MWQSASFMVILFDLWYDKGTGTCGVTVQTGLPELLPCGIVMLLKGGEGYGTYFISYNWC